MDYFPIFAQLKNRRCLVVGGGSVAFRKIKLLLQAHAAITVVAPKLNAQVAELVSSGTISYVKSKFYQHHLDEMLLVVAATDNPTVNSSVYSYSVERNLLCNSVDDPVHSSFITPAIVDRSPLIIAISSGGAAPVLARMIREKLEREIPESFGRMARVAKHWRDRVKIALSTLTARRRFWEDYFSSSAQDSIAPTSDAIAHSQLEKTLAQHTGGKNSFKRGEAWLVGAGPGDPTLLTIRAQQLLHRADVILHDRLVSKEVLALARRDAEFINVGKPLPGSGCANCVQQESTALLIKLVEQGQRVCRLKGGDPFIFGRGGEEVTALTEAGLPYQIVPGITAAAACAAYAGIPLTHRDHAQSVMFITGHGKNSIDTLDWPSVARDEQTVAVYMGVSRYSELAKKLLLNGKKATTPIAIVERGTTLSQRVVTSTLGELPKLVITKNIKSPAILIIGEVAQFAQTQQWFANAEEISPQLDVHTLTDSHLQQKLYATR